MRSRDRLSGLFFVVLSLAMCLACFKLQRGVLELPSYMTFPLLLSLSLLITSIVLFVKSGPLSSLRPPKLFAEREGAKALYLLITFFFSLVLLEPLGFVISIFLLIALLLRGLSGKTAIKSALYGMAVSVSTYLFFTRLLAVRLPQGILTFL